MFIASIRARLARAGARAAVALALPTLAVLAGCSGGGGGGGGATPPPTSPSTVLVFGTAATGAGIAGTVSIEDVAGQVKSLPVTADSGRFSASVDGMTPPFMLKVTSTDGATVLYSAVEAPGRANITPLTSLALMRIAAARGLHGPAELYSAPTGFAAWATSGQLASASSTMLARLMPAFVSQLPGASSTPDTAPSFDPFGTTWTVGSGVDALLDHYPVTFSTDVAGIVTALQTDHASGLAVDVARSDTAGAGATSLGITGAGQGNVVGGTATRLGALATFPGGAQQAVSANWSVTGLAGASVDSNGQVSTPAVDTVATITVSAHWFDGSQASSATLALTVVPAMRPTGIAIAGAAANAAVAPGASVPLVATVHWSDGSSTTPAVAWTWRGDAAAVSQLGSDGLLRTGRPATDSPIDVVATFSQGGLVVSSDLALSVTHFVRRVQSVTLAGLVDGQVMVAGDHADLTLTAHWNDGAESTLAPIWSAAPAVGATNHIAVSASAQGRLSTSAYYVPNGADAAARAAEPDTLVAQYDNGDNTSSRFTASFGVKPLVNIPTGLQIRGVTAMKERDTAGFQVFVEYEDGSTAPATAPIVSQQPALLVPTATAGSFTAAAYASQPSTPLVATLAASRSYTYLDINGQSVTTTVNASQAVTVNWVAPVLTALSLAVDHLAVGVATPVAVTGTYMKFGASSTATVVNAVLSIDSTLVSIAGNSLTATQAPTTAAASWATLSATATDASTHASVSTSRAVTVDLAGSVAKHLLAYAWSPLDPDVQFRAISSDGHVDDYTVVRTAPSMLGYESAATRRRLRLLSGASDFAQSRPDNRVGGGATQETQYVAAVEQGNVVAIRHADLYDTASLVRPIVLAGVTNARQVALVARRDDGVQTPAVRLYVLDTAGTVRQYRLPYVASAPLVVSDAVAERQLTGTWSQLSAGANFIELLSTSGGAFTEGAGESDALGDPTGASHWTDTYAVRQGFNCSATCTWSPLTGITLVHASVDAGTAALVDSVRTWPVAGTITLQWPSETRTVGPAINVTSLAVDAWVQSDGSVHFLNLAFAEDAAGGPGNIAVGSTQTLDVATWLPAATEIVDGRRNVVAAWPYILGETFFSPTMPIVRTTTDTLYYLDGRAIRDPQGNPIVLP